jgi:hypothetical protein
MTRLIHHFEVFIFVYQGVELFDGYMNQITSGM